ncbi:MAG: hypothetical protein JKY37_30285, partial [Nannocystaceae bacterium]|nr:hypothetical protein [Nannocystaceae bacterium]
MIAVIVVFVAMIGSCAAYLATTSAALSEQAEAVLAQCGSNGSVETCATAMNLADHERDEPRTRAMLESVLRAATAFETENGAFVKLSTTQVCTAGDLDGWRG